MYQFLNFFKTLDNSIDSIIFDWVNTLSQKDTIKVLRNNLSYCQIMLSKEKFFNDSLSNELNSFFSTYDSILCEDLFFAKSLIAPYPENTSFTIIGFHTSNGLKLLVKNHQLEVVYEDEIGEERKEDQSLTIYFYLVVEVLSQKFKNETDMSLLTQHLEKENR